MFLLLLALLAPGEAWTLEEAAARVADIDGVPVESLQAERVEGPVVSTATLIATGRDEIRRCYIVNLTDGHIAGVVALGVECDPPTQVPPTDEARFEGTARATARRLIGERADALLWDTEGASLSTVTYVGRSEEQPGAGPPECRVELRRRDGALLDFSHSPQYPPTSEARLQAADATGVAEAHFGEPDAVVASEPALRRHRGRPIWTLALFSETAYRYSEYDIDAVTGALVCVSPASLAPPLAPSASPTAEPATTSPPWVLYGGIALLCAAALGVFLLRRRLT